MESVGAASSQTHDFRRFLIGFVYISGRTSTLPVVNRHKIPAKERVIDDREFVGGIGGTYELKIIEGEFDMINVTLKNGARKFVASNGMVLAT